MRKFNFLGIIQRAFGLLFRHCKKFSRKDLRKAPMGFLGGLRKQKKILGSMFIFWMSVLFMLATFGGHNSPQVVPYSDLVEHLQSKTVTTALFQEGSTHLYFNLQNTGSKLGLVMKSGNTADQQVSDTQNGKEAIVSMPLTHALTIDMNNSARIGEPKANSAKFSMKRIVSPKKSVSPEWAYLTRRVEKDEAFLLQLMRDAGVKYSSGPQSKSWELITSLMSLLWYLPLVLASMWLQRDMLGMNKRKAKKELTVKFEDVAGVDIPKAELMEIVECIRGAEKFESLGAKVPKGVLLIGPPGTGKTLLARAVAGEAGVSFYSVSASEFVEIFVGRGAARVRNLFSEARKNAPSILFIDELDAVGGSRGTSYNEERDQTLNQLLTEMDGFESNPGVLVIAATNRPETLDPALCRPGRLSRRVHVTKPDLKGRQQILAVHMRGIPVEEDQLQLQRSVASRTEGFVGADLANVANEAAILAARKGRSAVVFEDFKEAIDRVKHGVGDENSNHASNSMYI